MTALRFFMLLSLVVWLGGIIFFAAAVAPTVFSVLPTRHLAGNVVTRSLTGSAHAGAPRHLLVWIMIVLTLISMYAIGARMAALRAQMGVIDDVPATDARRVEFNRLHLWSTRLETSVLVIGLVVLYLTARQLQ